MTRNITFEYPQILAEICGELVSFTHGRVGIDEDTELLGDLNLDSLQVMNLLLHVEDRFDISIPVSILPDVKTVKDLALRIEILAREG
ncbi:MAG: acyl carrier protein [Rhodoferax sp.]|uniref:acyl carrier protein n=1 Tax=Rhodoferax sp. TaxID=50421 RepID=UPI003BB5EA57|nr:acyl carrier protein [Rhodoferax sp.]